MRKPEIQTPQKIVSDKLTPQGDKYLIERPPNLILRWRES